MSELMIRKATRKMARLRLAICGPAGSGKTYSALLVAKGLGGRILLIDTEEGSGELYAGAPGIPEYDYLGLSRPYSPDRYIAALEMAAAEGYDVAIVDSVSHAWVGTGGVLDMHDLAAKAQRTENRFTAWREVTPEHNKLVDGLLQAPCHVIACMRSKTQYEIVDGKPQKIGMAPVQREGIDYEFTVVFDMNQNGHVASASKDRTSIFDGKPHIPTEKTGTALASWLSGGDEAQTSRAAVLVGEVNDCETAEALRQWWNEHALELRSFTASNNLTVKNAVGVRQSEFTDAHGVPKAPSVVAAETSTQTPAAAPAETSPTAPEKPKRARRAAAKKPTEKKFEPAPEPPPPEDEDWGSMFDD
jgi:hypothetical protein